MMYSYTHIEKEISKNYRERLNETKKPSEVMDVFSKTVIDLLSRINEDFAKYTPSDVKLDVDGETKYEISENLKKDPRFDYLIRESDLPAIIERLAKDAANRYLKLVKDDDKTATFNLPPKRKNF
ncbi:hypothetical protein [Athalassotoga saccharophila]|uniref:hypothetical protein n=1 Tax=Athalassotoga saccharophila TaxID=1441386 RepID=UPI0013798F0F|nr:hypothetical protein [Athalassotoga saccharophila]BBJ27903.1 hypothetical protein ATHSA_0797 [Athalassotoga saccharophila]